MPPPWECTASRSQRVTAKGTEPWQVTVFDGPQAEPTRRAVMRLLGRELTAAMAEMRKANKNAPSPVHLVVPDKPTADLLVSIADNMAGIELSRLRWERDKEMGRKALTFNGDEAQLPPTLAETDRTAVSFLLEEDRARALTLRSPIIDLRAALAAHIVPGGPATSAYRLDYLVAWVDSGTGPLDHRSVADAIEASEHTPGARLTNRRSDAIHRALVGTGTSRHRSGDGPAQPEQYQALVTEELAYKCCTLGRALSILETVPDSRIREVHRGIEGDAQRVWRRRLSLHASDLVRFGRTYRHWRNSLVPMIESDARCQRQLLALANPQAAHDLAADAGSRQIFFATVVSTAPVVLDVESRQVKDGARLVLLHVNVTPCVEAPNVGVAAQAGSFKFSALSIGPVSNQRRADAGRALRFDWAPAALLPLSPGDRLVLADFAWFSKNKGNQFLNVDRPRQDDVSAPKVTCGPDSFATDPDGHPYCCRSHEDAEADWSDELADRRARGLLNPQTWPPVRDEDAFEVTPAGAPVGDPTAEPVRPPPDTLTIDDLD